jgi:hypothetical protein
VDRVAEVRASRVRVVEERVLLERVSRRRVVREGVIRRVIGERRSVGQVIQQRAVGGRRAVGHVVVEVRGVEVRGVDVGDERTRHVRGEGPVRVDLPLHPRLEVEVGVWGDLEQELAQHMRAAGRHAGGE